MNKLVTLDFCTVEIHDSYLKAIMNEGITVDVLESNKIINLAKEYFSDKKFGYVTHRINSYSVNPIVYKDVSEIPNLVGFAIVSEGIEKLENSEFEKFFIKKPTKAFQKLESAIDWIKSLLND